MKKHPATALKEFYQDDYSWPESYGLCAKKGLLMAKAKAEEQEQVLSGEERECAEVQLGQSVQIGHTAITHLNANHAPQKAKLQSKIVYNGEDVVFKFDGKDCLIPKSVIKLIIFA